MQDRRHAAPARLEHRLKALTRTSHTNPRDEPGYFPGGLKVSLRPGDRAVYVGTAQYHRNEFFEIARASVVDDYERADAEFKKKFGTKYPLHKVLLTAAR